MNDLFRHANNYRTYGIANFAAAVNPHETIRPRLYCSPQITLKKHAWQKSSCQGLIKGPPRAYTKVPGRAPRVSKMDDSLDGGGGGQGAAVKVCSACYKKKEPACFSNKQWKAKAHQRKCVACAGGHAASAVGTTSDGGIVLASAEPAVQQDTHNGPFAPCDEMMAFLHATLRRWQHDRIAVVDLAHGEIKTLTDLNYTKACANRDYTSQRYLRAIEGYSSILSYIMHGRGELPRVLEQLRVTCLANRAMSLLKLARNSDAVNDCMECWQSLALHDTLGLRAKVLRRLELAGRPPSKEALATAKFAACEPRPVTIVTDEDVDKLVCRLRQYTHKKLSRDVLNRLLQVMGSHVDAAFMVVSNYLHDYGQEASSKRSNARERARETGGVFLTDTDLDAIEELLGLTGILQQQRAQE